MFKTLILIRHSKAENRNPSVSDFDRPLTEEGRRDSLKMANLLLKSGYKPVFIMGSSAKRAAQTVEIFSNVLNIKDVSLLKSLYYCSAKSIMDHIVGLPDKLECVIVVGHNPGISDLVKGLSSGRAFYMDNTQIIILEYEIDQWHQVGNDKPVVFQNHRVINTPDRF